MLDCEVKKGLQNIKKTEKIVFPGCRQCPLILITVDAKSRLIE